MEQHGNNPSQNVFAIIPARYESTRLPGKMLRLIGGKPLILHTVERAEMASLVSTVLVATDDPGIHDVVTASGRQAVMTANEHQSGSDRIAEVASGLPEGSIVVNIQGDEPLIDPATIDAAIAALISDDMAAMATTCSPITHIHDELLNGNVVKVVVDDDGYAMYFSRSAVPFPRNAALRHGGDLGRALENEPALMSIFKKHTGLYVYRSEYLLRFSKLKRTTLEQIESLEQLRALEDRAKIRVVEVDDSSIGVDTYENLDRVRMKVEFPALVQRAGTESDIHQMSEAYVKTVQGSYSGILPQTYLDGLSAEARSKVFVERRAENPDYGSLLVTHPDRGVVGLIDYSTAGRSQYGFEAHIFSFYIVPEYQRLGLGGILFRDCLRRLRKDGSRSVWLETFEDNPYRGFYEKSGGRLVATAKHRVDDRHLPTAVYGWDDLEKV